MSIDPRLASAFDRAFTPGFTARVEGADIPFEVLDLGLLTLRSGRLVACDPLADLRGEPFEVALPVGRFPVRLAVAESPAWGDRTVFARLALRDDTVARWAMATVSGQDAAGLGEDRIFGYGVDAGTGCFLDADTARALLADEDGYGAIVDAWIPETREGLIYRHGDGDVALFHSGFGDGCYATYVGYGADGTVVGVVTDFAVVDWAGQP